ncbi:MAG TPA: MFS transporter [Bryobacteraceae bacterium]|nr:MFS transporter [Bryobacteraceae bacterium]
MRKTDRLTWVVCGLLFLATVLNYLDRQVLSLTAPKLIAVFHLNQREFGELIAAFRYSYALVQVAGGWIVDAHGPRIVFPTAVGLWSAASILTAFAPTLGAISGCRVLLGAAEAFNWPCALKVTERMLPPADRPLGNGIFNSGTALGAMLAPIIVTVAVSKWGWRSPFVVTGALGAIWVWIWIRVTRNRADQLLGSQAPAAAALSILAGILRKKNFWLLLTSAVIVNGVSYFLADWIPLYLQTERGFSFGMGNALSTLVYLGLDAGNLITGMFILSAIRFGLSYPQARTWCLFTSCLLMSCATSVGFTQSRSIALICIILTAIGVAGFLVIYLTLVQDLEPLHVGAASGMLGGLGNLCYGFLSPYIGHLADLRKTTLTFLLVGLLPWLSFLAILSVVRAGPKSSSHHVPLT